LYSYFFKDKIQYINTSTLWSLSLKPKYWSFPTFRFFNLAALPAVMVALAQEKYLNNITYLLYLQGKYHFFFMPLASSNLSKEVKGTIFFFAGIRHTLISQQQYSQFQPQCPPLRKAQHRYFSTTAKVGTNSPTKDYENKLIEAPNDTELVAQIIKNLLSLGAMPYNTYIEKARATLNSMINSLPLNDPIYKFLNNKIQIPFEFKAKIREGQIYPDSYIMWEKLVSIELPMEWGGTYIFKQTQNNSVYVGSAISHAIRAIGHRDQFQGVAKAPSVFP
jgi:hypothetical protein